MAVKYYEVAHAVEPELPHYQLNLAAAHIKLSKYAHLPFLSHTSKRSLVG